MLELDLARSSESACHAKDDIACCSHGTRWLPVALADAPEGEKKEVGFARQIARFCSNDGPIAVKSGPHPEHGPKVLAGSGTGAESHLDIDQYCIRVWGKWHSARIAPIG